MDKSIPIIGAGIAELSKWAFNIQGCPIILRIKVVRTTNPPDMYIGIANTLALRGHAKNSNAANNPPLTLKFTGTTETDSKNN